MLAQASTTTVTATASESQAPVPAISCRPSMTRIEVKSDQGEWLEYGDYAGEVDLIIALLEVEALELEYRLRKVAKVAQG